jgi:hypothetical protein
LSSFSFVVSFRFINRQEVKMKAQPAGRPSTPAAPQPQGMGPSQLCLGVKSFYALPKRIAAPDATNREKEELDRSPPPVTTIANRLQALKSTVVSPQLCRYIDVVKSKHGAPISIIFYS